MGSRFLEHEKGVAPHSFEFIVKFAISLRKKNNIPTYFSV